MRDRVDDMHNDNVSTGAYAQRKPYGAGLVKGVSNAVGLGEKKSFDEAYREEVGGGGALTLPLGLRPDPRLGLGLDPGLKA